MSYHDDNIRRTFFKQYLPIIIIILVIFLSIAKNAYAVTGFRFFPQGGIPGWNSIDVQAVGSAQRAVCTSFTQPHTTTIYAVQLIIGTATAGSGFDIALYNASTSAKIWSLGSTTITGMGSSVNWFPVSTTTISAGVYYYCIASSNNTNTFSAGSYDGLGSFAKNTSFPLPTTLSTTTGIISTAVSPVVWFSQLDPTFSTGNVTNNNSTTTISVEQDGTGIFGMGIMLVIIGLMFTGFIWNSFNRKKKWQ